MSEIQTPSHLSTRIIQRLEPAPSHQEEHRAGAMCRSGCNLSPIHHLPNELLARIFAEITSIRDAPIGQYHPTITLGRVCEQWKGIMASTPALWTCLTIVYPNMTEPAKITAFWLKNSATLPIHVSLRADCRHNYTHAEKAILPLISVLRPTTHRWLTANLELSESTEESLFIPLLKSDFGQLKDLRIGLFGTTFRNGQNQLAKLDSDALRIVSAPNLQTLLLQTWWKTPVIPSGWASLQELVIHLVIPHRAAVEILTTCINLVSLNTCISSGSDDSHSRNPIDREHLCSLSLTFEPDGVPPVALFTVIRAPHLQKLSVVFLDWELFTVEEHQPVQRAITTFIRGSGAHLDDVVLVGGVLEEESMLSILTALKSVRALLRISAPGAAFTPRVFTRLTPHPTFEGLSLDEYPIPCPHIKMLALIIVGDRASAVDQRTEATIQLVEGQARRGIESLTVTSDAWTTVHPRDEEWERENLSDDLIAELNSMELREVVLGRAVGASALGEQIRIERRSQYICEDLRLEKLGRFEEVHSRVCYRRMLEV